MKRTGHILEPREPNGEDPASIGDLMVRMSQGDREAAAEFVQRYGPQVRRRIHGKLGPAMRRVFDSQDILSTVARRLDVLVLSGKLHVENQRQLWALLCSMAEHAVMKKSAIARRWWRNDDSTFGAAPGSSKREPVGGIGRRQRVEVELKKCHAMITDPTDRRILALRLRDCSLHVIATKTHMSDTAVSKRWSRIKAKVREAFLKQGLHPPSARKK